MKKLITLSLMAMMFVATMCVSSCSTSKSITKAFEKNGYVMAEVSPAQQIQVCPVMAKFPSFGQTAAGYLQAGNSCTFIYNIDESTWNAYTQQLVANGFSQIGTGFVKADKSAGLTYNVSAKATEVYKQNFMIVTFTSGNF